MLINGVNRLACKVAVQDLGEKIVVEPIRGLEVKKDLIVDMEPFFDSYRAEPSSCGPPREPWTTRVRFRRGQLLLRLDESLTRLGHRAGLAVRRAL